MRRSHRTQHRTGIDIDNSPIGGYAPGPVLIRFCMAALFGLFIDVVFLGIAMRFPRLMEEVGFWHLLLAIPLLWGMLGVFFLMQMLSTSQWLFETFFGARR